MRFLAAVQFLVCPACGTGLESTFVMEAKGTIVRQCESNVLE